MQKKLKMIVIVSIMHALRSICIYSILRLCLKMKRVQRRKYISGFIAMYIPFNKMGVGLDYLANNQQISHYVRYLVNKSELKYLNRLTHLFVAKENLIVVVFIIGC